MSKRPNRWYFDEQREDTQVLLSSFRSGMAYEQIGKLPEICISRQRVAKIREKLVATYGEEYLAGERYYTIKELVEETGLNDDRIDSIIQQGIIPFAENVIRGQLRFNFVEEELLLLKSVTAGHCWRLCRVCKMILDHRSRRRFYCSDECRRVWHYRQLKFKAASKDSLSGWLMELYKRLEDHSIPEDEEWVTRKLALNISGLTTMQVYYAADRGILSTQDHPEKKWRGGRPVQTFAVSELEIACDVYSEWVRSQDDSVEGKS